MSALLYFVFTVYIACLIFISIYCISQFHLLFHYRNKDVEPDLAKLDSPQTNDYPHITVQLPMYNEYYVVERLIDNIMLFDYPKDKFEVQILDDSTDDTIALTKAKVEQYNCLLYTSPSPRDATLSRMPSSA